MKILKNVQKKNYNTNRKLKKLIEGNYSIVRFKAQRKPFHLFFHRDIYTLFFHKFSYIHVILCEQSLIFFFETSP